MNTIEAKIYIYLKLLMQINMFAGLGIAVYRVDLQSIVVITLIILVTWIPLRLSTRFDFYIQN